MAQIEVVQTTQEHFDTIEIGERHDGEFNSPRVGPIGLTLIHDGKPIAICGGYLITEGVMQVWAFVSDHVNKVPIAFHKTMKGIVDFYMNDLKLRRMQMSVRTDFPHGYKWAKKLNFACEGIMKRYGANGRDSWLMARVNYDRT